MNLRDIYLALKEQKAFIPGTEINRIFTDLVSLVTSQSTTEHDLNADEVVHLQEICALAEYELERYWAKSITSSPHPKEALQSFPYLKNYHDLTRLEWMSLKGCTQHTEHSVLFCGGGPLPLTAIVLATDHGIRSTVIDRSPEAASLSRKVIQALGLADRIRVEVADASIYAHYDRFSVIFVAALAGIVPKEQEAIFSQIRSLSKTGTHIIARSSWGNRKLLYRPLSQAVYKFFAPKIEVHPHNDIVNSVVILEQTDL